MKTNKTISLQIKRNTIEIVEKEKTNRMKYESWNKLLNGKY